MDCGCGPCQACSDCAVNYGQAVGAGWEAPSGAKSSERKPRYDLIPFIALEREAVRMAEGAAVHGENNYQKGVGDEAFRKDRQNHALEHLLKYIAGDRSENHLAAVRCNAGMLEWLDAAKS